MKILNLDSFAAVKRQLVLGGKPHDVLETTVQAFIDNLVAAEAMDKAAAQNGDTVLLSEQVGKSVDAIIASVPTLPREELMARPIEVLTAIMKFIRGELDPDTVGDAPKESTEEGAGPKAQA